ncbi:hypothetical protein ACFVWR_14990 [Leifsonia sp. NPDC058292]|uniref:hypothetical protein n=1 Tax=Leifsonia sp. NPDC058292 TaxID=3346428 RepID=UPI0036DF0457
MTNIGYQQTPYAATPPAAPAPIAQPESRALSVTSLVLGLASIVFSWTFFAPVIGLVVGILALTREPASKTMAVWGIVLNAVMLAGAIFVALLAVVGVGVGFAFLPFAFL